jgi:hypothetical protein
MKCGCLMIKVCPAIPERHGALSHKQPCDECSCYLCTGLLIGVSRSRSEGKMGLFQDLIRMNIQRFSYLANCGNGRQIGLRNQFKALPISGSNLGPLSRLFLCHAPLFPVFSDVGGDSAFDLHNGGHYEGDYLRGTFTGR